MTAKLVIVCIAVFFFAQFVTAYISGPRVTREDGTKKTEDTSKAIDDILSALKNSYDDVVKNIKDNGLVQNITDTLQKFGAEVQAQGQQVISDIQKKTATST